MALVISPARCQDLLVVYGTTTDCLWVGRTWYVRTRFRSKSRISLLHALNWSNINTKWNLCDWFFSAHFVPTYYVVLSRICVMDSQSLASPLTEASEKTRLYSYPLTLHSSCGSSVQLELPHIGLIKGRCEPSVCSALVPLQSRRMKPLFMSHLTFPHVSHYCGSGVVF